MIKKTIYILLGTTALLIIAFLLQPLKKGSGLDRTTRFRLDTSWPSLPSSIKLGNPTGIALDTNRNVVVLHRADRKWPLFGPMPKDLIKKKTVLFINKDNGQLLHSWGDQLFIMPHGLTVDRENNLWITDVGLHQVFKFSHEGRLLLQLGEAGVAGNDSAHFNMPTGVAVADDGSFYVSDGYGNSRILRFTADGKYVLQWGTKGNQPGEFNIPHGITIDNKGWVYVADRENNRIQVFDSTGVFIKQLYDDTWGAINAVCMDASGLRLIATDDVSFLKIKHRGSDVFIFDTAGSVQTRVGRSGSYTGAIAWYHDVATDKDGNIYVGDIENNTIQKFNKIAQ